MSNDLRSVRGMNDVFDGAVLPQCNLQLFDFIVATVRNICERNNFSNVATPIVEYANLYERNLGNESDIIAKELYRFNDRGSPPTALALRPEFTAGVVRFFLENAKQNGVMPQKFFSSGQLFRYDRNQKGRYRQFHQINCEIIGSCGVASDIGTIVLAKQILESLGFKIQNSSNAKNTLHLNINFLGGNENKEKFNAAILKYLTQNRDGLHEDSRAKLATNPLRILDSKHEQDRIILQNAPSISSVYTPEYAAEIANIKNMLDALQIEYVVDENLVRGMDYYTGMVFEFTTQTLGSQATVLGGGRYDELISQISGGKIDLPAIGFAAGIERLALLLQESNFSQQNKTTKVAIITQTSNSVEYIYAQQILSVLTQLVLRDDIAQIFGDKIVCEIIADDNSLGKKMQKAQKLGCTFVVICGENEVCRKVMTVKNLTTGVQQSIDII
jgi:histidyl-tRNA synthetase